MLSRVASLLVTLLVLGVAPLAAAPVAFDLPAQPAADSLLAISRFGGVEIIFPFDELKAVSAPALQGRLEPPDAIARVLRDSGFAAHRYARGKYVIRSTAQPTGSIRGRLLTPEGAPAVDATVSAIGSRATASTDPTGEFILAALPPGRHRLLVSLSGFQPLQFKDVEVEADRMSKLPDRRLVALVGQSSHLEPYIVEGRSARMRPLDDSAALLGPRRATGNLDLPRSTNDALPFSIYTREQITRSGVVALNEFLQRAVLEGSATDLPPEQSNSFSGPENFAGSSNLKLRGFEVHETVILVNGRRLPEIQTSAPAQTLPADVNFIPLSLIQQVEVLPASASALYSGNPVGGVINIVLRPDVNATEVSATYTNALGDYDAPQSSVSLQHGQSLLDGSLRFRLNAVLTAAEPPTEAELGLRRAHDRHRSLLDEQLYRATPNIRTLDGSPLFPTGIASRTSVAPGADGTGGLAAFAAREGARNLDFFDSPGDLSSSPTSVDSPYGRRQRREVYFASATWDPVPWLQLGVDATHSRTVLNRGLDVLTANLTLAEGSPFNPFGREVEVTLAETAPRFGSDYSEARIAFSSAVAGVLLRLPRDWNVSLDAQVARNLVDYRGLAGADLERWQELVDTGRYLPLRDTQIHGPPDEFYDRVLIHRDGFGKFVRIGDYQTVDVSGRVSNQHLPLPTGRGALIAGFDYRLLSLADYREDAVFADGSPAGPTAERHGRTLERYSFFTEIQGPLLPAAYLPRGLRSLEGDIAVRYVASSKSNEVNTAPTFGLRAQFAGGLSFRASVTTSNRFPTPQLSSEVMAPHNPGGGLNLKTIYDPRRNQTYDVREDEAIDPGLPPEEAVTQSAGLVFERGDDHRLRASLDFVDTRKSNEILALDAQSLVNVEAVFPDRVDRRAATPSDPPGTPGLVTRVITGSVNASWRHSQNWNAALEYAWTGCFDGTLELRGRFLYYQKYERQIFANSPLVDQLSDPDGSNPALMRYRASFGANWSNRQFGFGFDGHYYHSLMLPAIERPSQGSDRVKPYWQFDAYVQADLSRWMPWSGPQRGLRAQLRVNNVSGFEYPKYVNHGSGTGVQAYGDWRRRTFSLSLTATF